MAPKNIGSIEHAFAKPVGRTPEKKESSIVLERLKSIIRTISGQSQIEVTTELDPQSLREILSKGQDPNEVWFAQGEKDLKTGQMSFRRVRVPEQILEKENVAKGKAAHEAAHVAVTRYGGFVPDDLMQNLGFSSMMAYVEELPTDEAVRERYAGAGAWVDEARRATAEEGLFKARSMDHLGYVPKFQQLCEQMVYGRHYEALGEGLPKDPEVLAAFERIKDDVAVIEKMIPKEKAKEAEIVEVAKERYRRIYQTVWAEMQKLIKDDLGQETLRQMIQQMMREQKKSEEEKSADGQKSGKPEGKMTEEQKKALKESIKKSIQEHLEKQSQDRQQQKAEQEKQSAKKKSDEVGKKDEKGEGSQTSQSDGTEKKEAQKEDGQKGEGEGQKSEKGEAGESDDGSEKQEGSGEKGEVGQSSPSSESGEAGKEQGQPSNQVGDNPPIDSGQPGEDGFPVPMDKLTPEIKQAIQEAFDELPEETKQQLKDEARKALEKLEDQLTKEMRSQLSDDQQAETHEEYAKREADEEAQKERDERIKQEKAETRKSLEELEKKIAEMGDKEEDHEYERVYQEIRGLDQVLYRRLEEIFVPNIKRMVKLRSEGSRINLQAVFKREAERGAGLREVETKIFESVHRPEKKDFVITLLVDLSGSMQGHKINETFRGVVLLTEVLNRLGIRFNLTGFQDNLIPFRDFHEPVNDVVRRRISGMVAEVSDSNPGGHNRASYNDDGPCLLEASEQLEKASGKEKFLIVLSDGVPEGRRSNADDLHQAVEKIVKTTGQKLIGVGLGSGTEHVRDYYPASLPNVSVDKLPEVLGGLLEDVFNNPSKYRSKG